MGDSSNSCRGFETPSLGSDLWPMGFDVDLGALDGPGSRNKGPGANNHTGALGNHTLNNLQSTNNNVGYSDMHHFTGLSSILQKFDDLHAGDIFPAQMTDLTNSLHKGDSETAQSLLAKLACQDLCPDLSTGPDNSHKGLDSTLFGHTPNHMSHNNLNSSNGTILQPKPNLQPSDVYGKVTCYEGKLVLQLRHFNLNTNYTLNVSECWICGEAIAVGSQLCAHKHVLGGLFQVNDEYVQMDIDIDHYVLPEHEPNTPDTPASLKYPVSLHSDSSNMHQQMNSGRDLNLSDNLPGGNQVLDVAPGNTDMHYHPDTSIVPSLSSSSNLMGTTSDHNSCLNSSFGHLSLPGIQLPVDHSNMHHGISGLNVPSVSASLSQTLHSGNGSVFSSSSSNHNQTNNILDSNEGNLKKNNLQINHTTGGNAYNLCHFPDNIQTSVASLTSQESMCELTVRNKISDTYQLPFSNAGDYTCHLSNESEKIADNIVHNTHISIETDSKDKSSQSSTPMKTTEVGAKKRKSRTPKKPITGKMKYEDNTISNAPLKPYKGYLSRTDASIEDWIRHNLPEGDLEVTETPAGNTASGESYPNDSKVGELSYSQGVEAEAQINSTSKHLKKDRPKDPDNTSRRAAHIISGGLDLSCRVCFKEYNKDVKNYKIHMKEHGIAENEYFSCSICSKIFAKYKHYMQHLKTHLSIRRFTCQICGASYSRDDKLRRHMISHSKDKPHKCTYCSKTFHRREYLDNHLSVHEGKKFKCDVCGLFCSSSYNLETHKSKHSKEKSFRCELCEKAFIRRDFLDSHMELVHKNKKLQCTVCQKLFSRKDVLKRHEAVHKNLSFDCDICNKKFTRRDRLVSHMKIHEKESEYKCNLCPSVFNRKEILEKHISCHNMKEQCNICFRFFPTKRKLQLHQESHKPSSLIESPEKEDSFRCEVCDKKMSTRNTLLKHLRQVHGKKTEIPNKTITVQKDKLFVCSICSKGFTRSCNLKAHVLKAHKKKDEDDENDLDDLPSVLQKIESSYIASAASSNSPENALTSFSYKSVGSISKGTLGTLNNSSNLGDPPSLSSSSPTEVTASLTAVERSSDVESGNGLPHFPSTLVTSTAVSHLTTPLNFTSSQFQSESSPDSPINLSTDAITAAAAACLLAYPSYTGSYQ